MARDLGDLAVSLSRAPAGIREGEQRGVRKAALYTTGLIRDDTRRDTGDSRLSGVGKRGARVGAQFKIDGGDSNPTATIRATGPYHLLERDTVPRAIAPRGRTLSKRYLARVSAGLTPRRAQYLKGAKALKFGGRFAASVSHPGTRGKHTFERAWKRAAPRTTKIYAAEVSAALKKVWGV